jgi:integrase
MRAEGGRSWIFQSGKKRVTIGKAGTGALSAAKAREIAKGLYARVALGETPWTDKREARARAAETFGGPLLARYLAHKRAELKPRSYEEVERHLVRHAAPLHSRPVDAIDQRTAAAFLSKIGEATGRTNQNRVRASGSGFYTWLAHEGIVAGNPFGFTNKAPEAPSRERTPNDAELCEIWRAAEGCGQYGQIVRLLMATGARRAEISNLRWSEIDVDAALVTLSGARTKGGRVFEIPVSQLALAILKAQPRRKNDDGSLRDLVFGKGEGGFQDWSASKRDLDARILANRQSLMKGRKQAEPMPDWHLHDFRRSMSTTMHERLGVPPHICESCLGHRSFMGGVAGVYNKSAYRLEKKRALSLWAQHLGTLIEGGKGRVLVLSRPA